MYWPWLLQKGHLMPKLTYHSTTIRLIFAPMLLKLCYACWNGNLSFSTKCCYPWSRSLNESNISLIRRRMSPEVVPSDPSVHVVQKRVTYWWVISYVPFSSYGHLKSEPKLPPLLPRTYESSINQSIIYSFIKSSIKRQRTIGERDMQGSVRALKAAPKLHNYNSTRNKNSDTQKYTYIMHIKRHTHTP